jgi:hypothetical protein
MQAQSANADSGVHPKGAASASPGDLGVLRTQVAAIIGRDLAPAEIAALLENPDTLETLRFEVDRVLKKVAGWNMSKRS